MIFKEIADNLEECLLNKQHIVQCAKIGMRGEGLKPNLAMPKKLLQPLRPLTTPFIQLYKHVANFGQVKKIIVWLVSKGSWCKWGVQSPLQLTWALGEDTFQDFWVIDSLDICQFKSLASKVTAVRCSSYKVTSHAANANRYSSWNRSSLCFHVILKVQNTLMLWFFTFTQPNTITASLQLKEGHIVSIMWGLHEMCSR